jgi:cytolysin (calcineurin-like family phosphatase)
MLRALTQKLVILASLIIGMMSVTATAADGITFIFTSDPQFCGEAVDRVRSCRGWGRKDVSVDWQIAGINRITSYSWPGDWRVRFGADGAIDTPLGIVIAGDLTENAGGFSGRNGGGDQWRMFTQRYEHGDVDAVRYPVYVGLGNHDLENTPRDRKLPRDLYRDRMWDYVAQRHSGPNAPVPADDFDPESNSYSWNWNGVHLVQLHRFGGDTRHDLPSNLPWLKRNLEQHASDGRPVVLFQHYGFESSNSIGSNRRSRSKWTRKHMSQFAEVINEYNVVGLFHGHDHWAQLPYKWQGYDVFSPGAAHFGQFAVVQIDHQSMNVVYAEVTNDEGDVRLIRESGFKKNVTWPTPDIDRDTSSGVVADP